MPELQTLADLVERHGGLDALQAVQWAARLARTVEPLHARGGAHGSLCADAVHTRDEDPGGDAWLSPSHALVSPPPYHCPERAVGGSISPADDVWAVAVTLYYALTGSMPFDGVTDAEVAERMAGAAPAPLAVFDSGDDELQSILDGALERIRSERVLAIRSLRLSLERWLAARGIPAPPALELDEDEDGPTARVVIEALAAVERRPPPLPGGAARLGPPRTPLPPPPPPGQPMRSAPLPPPPPPPTFDPPPAPAAPPSRPPPSSHPPAGSAPPKKRKSVRPKVPPPPGRVPSSRPPQKLPPPPMGVALTSDIDAVSTPLVNPPKVGEARRREPPSESARLPKHVEPPRTSRAAKAADVVTSAPAAVPPKKAPFRITPTVRNAVIGVSIGLLMAGVLFMIGAEPAPRPQPDTTPRASPRPSSSAPSPSPSGSATPPSPSSAPPARSGARTPIPAADVSSCVASMFPAETFVATPDQGWVCEQRDPRQGAERMREEVVKAGLDRDVSEGMREWAMLGWYELPAFVSIRARCCAGAEPVVLPASDGTCRSLEEVLRDLGQRVVESADDAALEEAVDAYSKTIFCLMKTGTARLYGRYPTPRGGEDTTFRKTLARTVGRARDGPPDAGAP